MNQMNQHAIVIGGSMAGLLTARVLSQHFKYVTIIERDPLRNAPEARKGQPQVRHAHGLLAQGLKVITRYFPDLPEALRAEGATVRDMGLAMRWFTHGGYRQRCELGIAGVLMSRPLLEWLIRQRVTALSNVMVLDGCSVQGLMTDGKTRVTGVRLERRTLLQARGSDWWREFLGVVPGQDTGGEVLRSDLVVDASGRGSSVARWLSALGYPKPEESVIRVNVGYATRLYRRNPAEAGASDWVMVTPNASKERRGAGAFPIEGERWIVSLGGWHGDHPPTDEVGFLEYAKSLPAPDIYRIVSQNEPLGDITSHTFPSNLRRHYEKLPRFPDGLLVLGDAVCSFNPLYGQGMTSAALQAATLDTLLHERRGQLAGLARPYFEAIAKVIETPWQLAVGEDLQFPETEGSRALGAGLMNRYLARLNRASHHDPVVCRAFLEVMNLITPPARLLQPGVAFRVLQSIRSARRQQRRPVKLHH
jgi:2-polyprenyl-6-methoxyphenol hydroxylase-like FAD-dependent oxidoreductase